MRFISKQFYFSILFLFLSIQAYQCTTIAHTSKHYIDKNADGNNNGISWEDAWQSFSDIEWDQIQPGDTIYISGGTDSTIYYETLDVDKSGTNANRITIIAGKYSPSPSGHSGRVIIDGGGTGSDQGILIYDRNYITIKGFEIRHSVAGVYVPSDVAVNCIILDSLNIYDYYGQAGIFLNGNQSTYTIDSTIIRNCRIVSFDMYPGQTDGLYMQGAQRTVIHNNFIHIPNQDPLAHNDAVQGYHCNGFVIYNNVMINDSVNSPEGGGIPLILGSEGSNPVIIYNNFIYMGGVWLPNGNMGAGLCLRWYDVFPMPPTWIIHNTIVVNGPRCRGVWLQYPATMVNNIIAMFSNSEGMESINVYDLPSAAIVDSIRKNLFWCSWSEPRFSGQFKGSFFTGSVSGWTDWLSIYGGTDVKADPLFVKHIGHVPDQGALNGRLQSNSPTINQGENVKALIESFGLPWSDIEGKPRDIIPDIGAYEYIK